MPPSPFKNQSGHLQPELGRAEQPAAARVRSSKGLELLGLTEVDVLAPVRLAQAA